MHSCADFNSMQGIKSCAKGNVEQEHCMDKEDVYFIFYSEKRVPCIMDFEEAIQGQTKCKSRYGEIKGITKVVFQYKSNILWQFLKISYVYMWCSIN